MSGVVEQEVPVGYKKTEVGIVPKDWDVRELRDLLEKIIGGGTPSRSNPTYWGNEIPWVTVKDFATFNPVSSQEYITKLGLVSSSSNLVPGGILITSTRMALGKAVIYDIPVAINQDLKALFPNKRIETKYLYYWFEGNAAKIDDLGSGSTVKGLSLPDLKQIKFILPSNKEQTAIANVLSDVDALITSLEKLITKKRAIKTAAMQQLLTGKKRLPPFDLAHTGYKQTELGEIPKDWELVQLGMVLDKIIGGGTPSRANSSYWSGNIPWVTVKDFATFNPTISQEYITKLGLENSSSSLIPEGVLITSTRMALGKAVIYNVPVTINQDLKALFSRKIVDTKFLYYWFEDNVVQIDDLGSGSTVKGLSLLDLKALKFRLPSKHEQIAIANVLSDMDKEIDTLEQRLNKTQQLKQGMMQELLTGRTRLI